MKKVLVWFLLLVAAGGIGAVIVHRVQQKSLEEKSTKPKTVAAIAVDAVKPERASIHDRRIFTGTLKPWSLFEVAPKVGGRLQEINFDVGGKIRGGDVIARIEDTEYKQIVDQNEADLDVARAQLQQTGVMLDLRRREYERQQTLDTKKATTQAQLESAETAFRSQEAAYKMQAAEVKRREAILDNAQLKLADCVIRADWPKESKPRFVGMRSVDQGALLAPNQPILSVAELDPLLAVIYVIERDYPYLKHDQTATVTTDAYPRRRFQGKVVRIAQLLEDNTRQAAIQLEIPNADLLLKPGMFVRVQLEFSSKPDAVTVPRNAIVKRDGKPGVFALDVVNAKVNFVPVETGIAADERIEIVSPDLKRPVVTLGNHLLTDGVPVLVPEAFRSVKSITDTAAGK